MALSRFAAPLRSAGAVIGFVGLYQLYWRGALHPGVIDLLGRPQALVGALVLFGLLAAAFAVRQATP